MSPLSTHALALLEQLRVITGASRWRFPHRDKPDTFATHVRLCYLMRDLNIATGASPHCWRTTFSTWANENCHRPDAIEKQLAHVESNKVRATYNKALLVDERRKIMQAWGDYLAMAEAENVIPMRAKAASPRDSDGDPGDPEPFAGKSEWGDHGRHGCQPLCHALVPSFGVARWL